MPTTRSIPAGLHLDVGNSTGGAFAQDVWFDTDKIESRLASTQLGVKATGATTAHVFHKFDGGRRDAVWKNSDFFIPANLGQGSNEPVEVSYFYSNTNLNVQLLADRNTIDAGRSAFFSQVAIKSEATKTGRYRYLVFDLSASAGTDAFIQEYGGIQTAEQPVEIAEELVLVVDGVLAPTTLEIVRGSTVDLVLHYRTAVGATASAFDLTGATVRVSLHRSAAKALAAGVPLVGPLSATLDADPTTGNVTVTLGSVVAETDLTAGVYLMEFLLTQGGKRHRHFANVNISGAVTAASLT